MKQEIVFTWTAPAFSCKTEFLLQGSMIDGHKLDLRLSMRKGAAPQTVPADKAQKDAHTKSTKIVVRNVAFEATSKEIRALFQPFGQIKSVRLPKKFNNSHRYASRGLSHSPSFSSIS